MRNISFFITTPQFLDRTKDVTRRMGWKHLKAGDILMAVEKAQGLKKGEKIKKLGMIKVVNISYETLDEISQEEVCREGFFFSPNDFISMFCNSNKGCNPKSVITRIEYQYL